MLFDLIDLLALFGVYAGIIFKAHEHACLKDWVMDVAQDWWFLLNHFFR